jgi:hypothetical protein
MSDPPNQYAPIPPLNEFRAMHRCGTFPLVNGGALNTHKIIWLPNTQGEILNCELNPGSTTTTTAVYLAFQGIKQGTELDSQIQIVCQTVFEWLPEPVEIWKTQLRMSNGNMFIFNQFVDRICRSTYKYLRSVPGVDVSSFQFSSLHSILNLSQELKAEINKPKNLRGNNQKILDKIKEIADKIADPSLKSQADMLQEKIHDQKLANPKEIKELIGQIKQKPATHAKNYDMVSELSKLYDLYRSYKNSMQNAAYALQNHPGYIQEDSVIVP